MVRDRGADQWGDRDVEAPPVVALISLACCRTSRVSDETSKGPGSVQRFSLEYLRIFLVVGHLGVDIVQGRLDDILELHESPRRDLGSKTSTVYRVPMVGPENRLSWGPSQGLAGNDDQ